MATYKGIQGFTIQNLSADPSNPIEGQVWYNSFSNVWKVEEATATGAFATGNNMNTARRFVGSGGTQTAAVGFSGAGMPVASATETYNGTSWTTVTSMGTARYGVACGGLIGTQTASLAIGGFNPSNPTGVTTVEAWNGSAWGASPSINTARFNEGVAGTTSAGLIYGGRTPDKANAESYDGSTWTNVASMSNAGWAIGCFGTQTAAMAAGREPSISGATEEYDGSTWTAGGTMSNTTNGKMGVGTLSAGLIAGGYAVTSTELYDGTTWTSNPSGLSTARGHGGSGGDQASAVFFGGYTSDAGGTNSNVTEEWTGPGVAVTKTLTVS